jgi:hypothetical protein
MRPGREHITMVPSASDRLVYVMRDQDRHGRMSAHRSSRWSREVQRVPAVVLVWRLLLDGSEPAGPPSAGERIDPAL